MSCVSQVDLNNCLEKWNHKSNNSRCLDPCYLSVSALSCSALWWIRSLPQDALSARREKTPRVRHRCITRHQALTHCCFWTARTTGEPIRKLTLQRDKHKLRVELRTLEISQSVVFYTTYPLQVSRKLEGIPGRLWVQGRVYLEQGTNLSQC